MAIHIIGTTEECTVILDTLHPTYDITRIRNYPAYRSATLTAPFRCTYADACPRREIP